MRYFIDCEFQERLAIEEDLMVIDPISIGIVSEDGRTYEAYFNTFKYSLCSEWVIDNVLTHLPPISINNPLLEHKWDYLYYRPNIWEPTISDIDSPLWKSRAQIKEDLISFIDIEKYGKAEFWGYFPATDWVMTYQIFGPLVSIPKGWPYRINDLKQVIKQCESQGLDIELPSMDKTSKHIAINDALYNQRVYEYLKDYIEDT